MSSARERVFATSGGHPYARFRRALDRGNAAAAASAAAELQHVGLVDALELCLLVRGDDAKLQRAIVRWHARYAAETPGVTVEEAQAVLALLQRYGGQEASSRPVRLPSSSTARGFERACEVLIRWADDEEDAQGSGGLALAG